MAKAALNNEKAVFVSRLGFKFRKKLAKCCIWSVDWFGAEIGTLRTVDQKYLGNFEMWCWRMMEKISWTDRVRNEEVLLRVKEEVNILCTTKKGRFTGLFTSCVGTAF